MTFDKGIFFSEGKELVFSDESCAIECRVKGWAGMTFGEDNAVVEEMVMIISMKFKSLLVEEEDREYV